MLSIKYFSHSLVEQDLPRSVLTVMSVCVPALLPLRLKSNFCSRYDAQKQGANDI